MIDGFVGFQEFPNIRGCEQVPATAGFDLKFKIGDFRTGKRR
jgi:hypothetical protein